MEDVGSLSIYNWYRATNDPEPHLRAVSVLTKIHQLGDVPGRVEVEFDLPDLLFETNYFTRHFLIGYCNFPESIQDALSSEFYRLAKIVSLSPKGLMHRDFQSQNIFIVPGAVRVVDFQGARRGFIGYDLASLVEDPYLNLPESIGKIIISHYLTKSELSLDEKKKLLDLYPFIAIQRLLQATAAYAYLSRVEGKWQFERFIIPASERILKLLAKRNFFPTLNNVLEEVLFRAKFEMQSRYPTQTRRFV